MKAAVIMFILTLAVSPFLAAQEAPEQAETYIYATYFYCDTARQEEADKLVKMNTGPIYDAAVADGTITGWGWLGHHTGGQWRRVQYHTANTLADLLKALETIGKRVEEAGHADDGFADICGAHDDYIWKREAGSAQQSERGPAALSIYEVCSFSGEQRAKEIVQTVFAPVLDQAVADGKLSSWGWNSHLLGGKYRVLQTMTAKDYPTLLKARSEILETLYGDGEKAARAEADEYSNICTSHTDYLWNVQHEKS